VTTGNVGAERLEVNNEHEESYKLAVANDDPKLAAWELLADEREVAEQELERRQRAERRGLTFPETEYPVSKLIDHRHAQERRALADKFAKQYRSFIHVVDAGGDAATAAMADMWLRRDAIQQAIPDCDDEARAAALEVCKARWRAERAEAQEEARRAKIYSPQSAPEDPFRLDPRFKGFYLRLDKRRKEEKKLAEQKPIVWQQVSDLAGQTAPARRWLINDFVPMRNVTNYTGDGGVGKSLVALQLAVAVALGRKWLGMPVLESGPVIVYSAEDEFDETWRRLEDICRELSVDIGELTNLHVATMAGMDAMLSITDDSRMMEPTLLWEDLRSKAEAIEPALVIIDTLADVYGGDENTRQQVKQFVGMLVGMSFDLDCAVMLLSHPSVSGMSDGTGRSGTTGWNNAFRSRLYQDRVVAIVDGRPVESDPDLRVIRNNKLNYGRKGKEVRIRWKKGIFVNEDVAEISPADAAIAAENAFMNCLALIESQRREVNTLKNGAKYAPKVFVGLPEAAGYTKHQLGAAMERLLKDKVIRIAQEGSGSRRRDWLTTTPAPTSVSEGPVAAEPATDTKLERAKQFLREQLASGPVPSIGLYANAKEALISRTTLGRAAEELGVKFTQDAIGTTLSLQE
jgi:RecA-family ATPase